MRTFEFSDAKSHKFWNVDVQGKSFTVTYGKIGAAGQSQTKSFPSPEKAQAEADKLVREKTGKGYVETTPKASTSDAERFEAALRANPDDLTGWGAYADFLAERGDPRGEFMHAQLALEDESRPEAERKKFFTSEKALIRKHEKEWLGPLAEATQNGRTQSYWTGKKSADRPAVSVWFHRGWVRKAFFYDLCVEEARALSRAQEARMLYELVVTGVAYEVPEGEGDANDQHYPPGPDVPTDVDEFEGPSLHVLARCPHLKNVRVFQLGDYAEGKDIDMNCHTPGELAHHLVKQMPDVEEVRVLAHHVDGAKLFALPMPKLRVLMVYHSKDYPLAKLAANKTLSNLTTIDMHPHAIDFDDDVDGAYIRLADLRAICRSPNLKSLTTLRLRLTDFGDKGAKEIVESGILKRLRVLDLRGGCISDAGAKSLADCPDLKNLEFLNLEANALTKDGVNGLKATGVNVSTKNQHNSQPGEFGGDEIPEYLFDGDIE